MNILDFRDVFRDVPKISIANRNAGFSKYSEFNNSCINENVLSRGLKFSMGAMRENEYFGF